MYQNIKIKCKEVKTVAISELWYYNNHTYIFSILKHNKYYSNKKITSENNIIAKQLNYSWVSKNIKFHFILFISIYQSLIEQNIVPDTRKDTKMSKTQAVSLKEVKSDVHM